MTDNSVPVSVSDRFDAWQEHMELHDRGPNDARYHLPGGAIVSMLRREACRKRVPVGFTCKEAGFSPENFCDLCGGPPA